MLRHRAWQTLQDRMRKGLEEKDVFQGKLCEESDCVHVGICVIQSQVLFAVSTSSVCSTKEATVCTPTLQLLGIM